MKVILAENAGFCMGVRRAVETTLDMVRKNDKIATFGPLIHNPQVLGLLEERGVEILREIPDYRDGAIIIRAHGVPPESKAKLRSTGAEIHDATCPRVLKVQAIIRKHQKDGFATVIIGDRNHAEVDGLLGFAGETGQVVSSVEEARSLELSSPYIIVSQTTQDDKSFALLSTIILEHFPGGLVFNTICDSTHKRQAAVLALCGRVEAMVVVGGRSSANTRRLAELVEKTGCPVHLVETEEELDPESFKQYNCVGVTAGASTPSWLINRAIQFLESIPGRDESRFGSMLGRLIGYLMASNLYVGVGGGLLACAVALLLDESVKFTTFMLVAGYLFSMHNLNRFIGSETGRFSDPVREKFRHKFRRPVLALSWAALSVSLLVAYLYEDFSFPVLAVMGVLGVLYSVRFIPRRVSSFIKVRRLKEIPGSKTFFVAMAWAFVIIVVPYGGSGKGLAASTVGAFLFVLFLVYVRGALYDVFEVQGDRIAGKETLPVCIGQAKTMRLLYGLIVVLALLPLAGIVAGLLPLVWLGLLPPPFYLFAVAARYDRGLIPYSPKLEFAVDSIFPLTAGLIFLVNILNP
ncbi:MAG: 4-hydroxy-3-methylbut-2-enyl diphosphate reductase [Desulfobulbales bacterium]|nr:4-hydroxy-3-methylbut-2-enyl diphosphate reductase [Desulfobulbales bacterium]